MNIYTKVNQAKLAACWGQKLPKHQLFVRHCRKKGNLQITAALNFLPQPNLQQQCRHGSASWRCGGAAPTREVQQNQWHPTQGTQISRAVSTSARKKPRYATKNTEHQNKRIALKEPISLTLTSRNVHLKKTAMGTWKSYQQMQPFGHIWPQEEEAVITAHSGTGGDRRAGLWALLKYSRFSATLRAPEQYGSTAHSPHLPGQLLFLRNWNPQAKETRRRTACYY